MPSYSFTNIEIEETPAYEDLAKAMQFFRQYGVQNGHISVDGVVFEKVVDGKIVETLQLENKPDDL